MSFETKHRRSAEAGKHVYLDKPLATTVEDANRLLEAARRAGARGQMQTQIGHLRPLLGANDKTIRDL